MRRIQIASMARKHLEQAKAHRKNEAQNRAFAESIAQGGDFFGSRQFASDAIESRRLARYYAKKARKSLPPGYTAAKKLVRKAKIRGKKLVKNSPLRKL